MPVLILKTKSSCQVIEITLTVLMVSQHQQVQPTQDIAERLTGQEREVLIITQVVVLYNITAITGLVLLAAATPSSRGVSTTMVTSAITSTTSTSRATVCVPAFQSRLRSLRSNNQRINHRLSSKIKRGGET